MKQAVAYLLPYIEAEKQGGEVKAKGKILLATVKGDVHDIGKNIVGVVLACNNYEIIDLGVMVPADKILKTAIEENVDIIGLSGLITPSLDEMVHVASEMQRLDFNVPLLIGGATTSKAHTAVKIEQHYKNDATVYVSDASRSVNVVSTLLNEANKPDFANDLRNEYAMIRERTANRKSKRELVDYRAANRASLKLDWDSYTPPTPAFTGTKVLEDYPLEKLIDYIDWTPFFITWSLAGKYPAILSDEKVGAAARDLFKDAQQMLTEIVQHKLITARAVFGFWEGNSVGNDVHLGASADNKNIHFLRQQMPKQDEQSHLCLADFVAPKESGKSDYLGGFAVTAGIGAEALAKRYQDDNNDYASLMIKALADRLAEAFAEHLHARVRAEYWAYAPDESLSTEELISERYRGIRPAPGYPACPEHSEKETLFSLLDAEKEIGIALTDSYAMTPAASVSGYYFSHPDARYFSVGKISGEQVEDLASRSSRDFTLLSRLLGPNLD